MNFDEARAAHPTFGFSVYALTPGAGVTLEVITAQGEIFTFTGPTEQAALDEAFPPQPPANVFD